MNKAWVGAVVVAAVSGAGLALAKDAVQSVIGVVKQDDKYLVTIDGSGQAYGVMPGDKGYFLNGDGKKAGSDYEFTVTKISDHLAWALTAKSPTFLQQNTAMLVQIAGSKICATKGKKPDLAASKGAPPAGWLHADVRSVEVTGPHKIAFKIWKGSDEGVMPSSAAYVHLPGAPAVLPYKVDMTWVTRTEAGGYVDVGAFDAQQVVKGVKEVGVEIASCKAK